VEWRTQASALCVGDATVAIVEGAAGDGQGDAVLQLRCTGPAYPAFAATTVVLGPNGWVLGHRQESGQAQYLGTAGGVTAVLDGGQVTAWRTAALGTAVWSAPANGAVDSREVVAGANGAIDVWAEGGYRDLATGQPAGFGAHMVQDETSAGFLVVDGRLFETGPGVRQGSTDVTLWTAGSDVAVWGHAVTLDGGVLAAAGGDVVASAAGGSVVAYDAQTGAAAWTYRPEKQTVRIVDVFGADTAAAAPGSASPARFAVVESDGVVWLDAASGQVVARVPVSGLGRAPSAALTPDGLVVVTVKGLVGVSPDGGGEVAWTVPLSGALRGATIAERGGAFYLEATTTPGQVQAVAPLTF
jgi:hypothetical protein